MIKNIFFAGLLLLAVSCTSTKTAKTESAGQTEVARSAAKFPGYTQDDWNKGKAIYTKNCGSCHGLKDPKLYSEESLRGIVPNMVVKTNKKLGMVIDDKDEEILLRYLITMSSGK